MHSFKPYKNITHKILTQNNKSAPYWLCALTLMQALVDSPEMVRSQINFKRLTLTDITIDIKRTPKKKELIKAMEAAGKIISNLLPSTCLFC